jgi:DNA-binding GntR family transcriptional regulator
MTSPAPGAQQPITRAEPLREAVYLRIVELISSGAYAPGAPLTEAGLSRTLQVSRTPVREALLRLQAEGVLTSTLARGFTVRTLAVRDAAELYPVLATLEGLAVRSVTSLDETTLDTLRRTLDQLAHCTEPVQRWRLDTTWHTTLTAAARNRHLQTMIGQLRTNLSRYELAYMREVWRRDTADRQHAEILAAITAGERDHAAALVERHWHDGMKLVMDWLAARQDDPGERTGGAA